MGISIGSHIFLILLLCGSIGGDNFLGNSTSSHSEAVMAKRQKRFLAFEKGSSFTLQGNTAKSIISGTPRGLNEIFEYTLVYDLPTGLDLFKHEYAAVRTSVTTTRPIIPWDAAESWSPMRNGHNNSNRKYEKCPRRQWLEFRDQTWQMCLRRTKRVVAVPQLTTSQRMFYDIIEKWSQIHGFLPRYCFMRTLCEARHFLLPYGCSLMHDIIHVFMRHTTPWARHHHTFGQVLRQHQTINECAALYGPHCRLSLLQVVTKLAHGSKIAGFMV
ncbi:uncharacterized protein LOC101901039 isoform X2 [Musca domestica]|uniref:Uncharacterized protein LOC101901039 isoform X2 n=1 Tax=Musca domestica TaxID=7370 RepID=A0A9J7DJ20_MUSDO|nr:uncharacterized protein LOC101901039 isoform X2 [Musca domestica]